MTKKSWRLDNSTFLVLLMLAGAFLRFWDIAKASIWHDEGFTMMLAPMDVSQIIARTARDVHPPLYYLMLHYWMEIFGNSETAARGLSAVLLILAIPVAFFLMRRLFNERTARIGALFVATGPFLIRYSQEARMYAMEGFLVLLATYILIRAVQTKSWTDWMLYAITIAAALYTHYFAVFAIFAHWLYMLSETKKDEGLLNPRWWAANLLAAAAFIPWLPSAYAQFTRVQAGFWIPHVTAYTLPNTVMEFMTFTSSDNLSLVTKILLSFLPFVLAGISLWRQPRWRTHWWLLLVYCLSSPLIVFLLSLKRPIFVDRYFVFSALAFYLILAAVIGAGWLISRYLVLRVAGILIVLFIFSRGLYHVHQQANHKMAAIGNVVNTQFQPGDEIVSGELYTFFDFSYYNHTGQQVRLYNPKGLTGYNESSLIYDNPQVLIRNYSEVHPVTGFVWLVGKTGKHTYFDDVPANWHPIGPHYTAGFSVVQKYQVSPI
jgi:mannosyltransferase